MLDVAAVAAGAETKAAQFEAGLAERDLVHGRALGRGLGTEATGRKSAAARRRHRRKRPRNWRRLRSMVFIMFSAGRWFKGQLLYALTSLLVV